MQSKSVLLSLSLGRATECHSTSDQESGQKARQGSWCFRWTNKRGHLTKISGLLRPGRLPLL